jgi:hypothetical protein
MAKVYTGRDGALLIGGTTAGKVVNWSLEGQADVLDTTSLADDFRTYELGMRSFTGSATLLFYANDAGRNDAEVLLKAAKAGTKTSLILRLGATGTPTLKDTSISCIITSYSFGAAVGELVQASISFTVSGEPAYLV